MLSHLILTHLKFSACDCGHNELRATGQDLSMLERRAIRGHDLTSSHELQRLASWRLPEFIFRVWDPKRRGLFRSGGCVDPEAPRLLRSYARDAHDGGLVRRGGEDDLLNRGGAPLSGRELQD